MSYPYQSYYTPYPQIQSPMVQNTQQTYQQPMPQPPQQTSQQTYQQSLQQAQQNLPIQNGGFALVPNEQVARDYLLAPGTFMTFKNEHAPYMYEKSRSFSQLDAPVFKKYRLVEEEDPQPVEVMDSIQETYALETEYKALCAEVEVLKEDVDVLREMMNKKPTARKKETNNE